MNKDNVTSLVQPEEFSDMLTKTLRSGARQLLAEAIEVEVQQFLAAFQHLKTEDGHQRVVRHGYLPERKVQTGIGPVAVRKPRVRDRAPDGEPIKYTSSILPAWMRRSKSLDELIPALYLRGISTGDFREVLSALLGPDAPNLSPETIRSLKTGWKKEHDHWQKRDLSARSYVYFWADGVYLNARMEHEKQCILVIIGATPEGKKELVGFTDGYRESAESWRDLLLDLKQKQGLKIAPKLAVGDGAMGFWKALHEVFPDTKHQRCWVHKTANVLNKLPKSLQAKAKDDLHQIWMSGERAAAETAFDLFVEKYGVKHEKAVACLQKDRDKLLTFYDFPAEHWKHLRTTNPIESTFATVKHRTIKTKGSLSRETAMIMVFKLVHAAQKRWQKLAGRNQLPKVIQNVIFKDGIQVETGDRTSAA